VNPIATRIITTKANSQDLKTKPNQLPGNISFISPRQYEFGSNPFLLSIWNG